MSFHNPEQNKSSIREKDTVFESMAEYYSRNMNGENFIQYMGEIGWAQGGEFAILLSAMGYHF